VILNKAEVKRLKKRIVQLRALIELYDKGLKELQNTFNKPVFERKPSTGKLTVTRPIKPTK